MFSSAYSLGCVCRDPSIKVLKASAEAIEAKTPYYPWKKIFAKLLGVDEGKQTNQFTHRACMNSLRNILEGDFEEHSSLNDVLPVNIPHKLGAEVLDPRARCVCTCLCVCVIFKIARC